MPAVSEYFLRTERVGIRHWSHDDADVAFVLWGDPAVTSHVDSRGALSREDAAARLADEIHLATERGIQYWPVFLLATGEHIGVCGLHPKDNAASIHELGFHLRPKFWGRGLATEAARGVITHAFDVIGVPVLVAGHHPNNDACKRVIAKLGFVYIQDEFYSATGLRQPTYVLTKEQYRYEAQAK